jgi:hypothetical protein
MRWTVSVVLLATVAVAAFPSTVAAQTASQDSAVAAPGSSACLPDDPFGACVSFEFSATSEPTGGDPSGQASVFVGLLSHSYGFGGPVTCLAVAGNSATIGGETDVTLGGIFRYRGFRLTVVDGGGQGSGLDTISYELLEAAPTDCSEPSPFPGQTVTAGDIVVHDAQGLPVTKNQCKNGGWRNYAATFKNEGGCVSFVATGGKNPPAG